MIEKCLNLDDRLAVGYLRVSGLSQAGEDRGGLPRQREALESYAKAHSIGITQWFEEAFTGTDLENRPAYRAMREALLSNGVRTVLIEKLDRLARDQMICEFILQDLRKHGVEVLSCEPGEEDLQSKNPTRKLIRTILAAIAEFDRSCLVERMRVGKARARANGKIMGGRAKYGSHKRYPQEVAIVNRVFHLRRQGFNATRIAEVLNDEGMRSRKGTAFFPNQIARIMKRQKGESNGISNEI